MPQSPQLKEGEIVNGHYRVLAKIGEGGMGSVYKVEQTALKRVCALKSIKLSGNEEAQQAGWLRLMQEAQMISKLTHKSIIQVYDFGRTADGIGLSVMDLV